MAGKRLRPVAFLLLLLVGCASPPPPKPQATIETPQVKIDDSDVLIRHLLRRLSDQNNEIAKSENLCLDEQNALLRGQRVHHTVDPMSAMDRAAQQMLDSEAAIEEHNRKHPNAPWADIKDVLRQFCGDCKDARAIRDSQIASESKSGG